MTEREQIVAWLRKEAEYSQAVADDETDFLRNRCNAEHTARVKTIMADAIERGDHLKGE